MLFLFIATIGVMLIYGIIAGGFSLASWASGQGMKQTANQNMGQRADNHNG